MWWLICPFPIPLLTILARVRVITTDGRLFEGILESFDHSTNIIISNTLELLVYPDGENQIIPLGVYLLRGGNVVCIGEVDTSIETEWMAVHGCQLKSTKNPL